MGDRGNIQIQHPKVETPLYLYTHWSGSRIAEILAQGLQKCINEDRLSDHSYATRIIFDTLTGLEGGSIGYGISMGQPDDNEHDIPVVKWIDYNDPVIEYQGEKMTAQLFIIKHGKLVEVN